MCQREAECPVRAKSRSQRRFAADLLHSRPRPGAVQADTPVGLARFDGAANRTPGGPVSRCRHSPAGDALLHLIENSHGPCIMAVTPFSYNRPRRAGDLDLVGVSAIDAFAEWIDRHAGSISCGEFDDRGPQQPPTPAVNSNIPQYDAFARNQIQFPLHPQLLR